MNETTVLSARTFELEPDPSYSSNDEMDTDDLILTASAPLGVGGGGLF
jgi:hypothetical protein